MQHFQRAMRPGAYIVDRIPLLKWIPGYGRELKEYHNFEIKLYRDQMDRVRSEMVSKCPPRKKLDCDLQRASNHYRK